MSYVVYLKRSAEKELDRLHSEIHARIVKRLLAMTSIPADLQTRCDELTAKRQAETLTSEEHQELIRLTDQFGELNVRRLEYLTELAHLRQTSLAALMKDLGIQAPTVA